MASIRSLASDVQQLWGEVNDASNEREQALMAAKLVHKLDRDADDTLNWLEEKEAAQVGD